MRIIGCVSLIVLGTGCVLGCGVDVAPESEEQGHLIEHVEHVKQTPEEALADDNAATAEALGVSVELVEERAAFQEEFERQVAELNEKYPNRIAGGWTDPLPEIAGHIRFVGDVPADAKMTGRWAERTEIIGGGRVPLTDALAHGESAAEALKLAGHRRLLTYYSVQTDELVVEMRVDPGSLQPRDVQIVDQNITRIVRDKLVVDAERAGTTLTERNPQKITALPVRAAIEEGLGPIVDEMHDYGGARLEYPSSGSLACTTGFTVSGSQGNGYVTAGHCILAGTALNYEQPEGGPTYASDLHSYVFNTMGDSMYRSSSHGTYGEFYVGPTTRRDQVTEWSGGVFIFSGIGASACNYGRATNAKICGQTVVAAYVTRVTDGGVTVGKLVRVTDPSQIGGDSGGPYFYGTKAMGVTHGNKSGYGYFTPVYWIEQALGVDIIN